MCARCGNVLAESMHAIQMTKKVRVRCGVCSTVNVAVTEDPEGVTPLSTLPGASASPR